MLLIAQLKCLHTNACSMGNKQEELEHVAQLENCDLNDVHRNAVGWTVQLEHGSQGLQAVEKR